MNAGCDRKDRGTDFPDVFVAHDAENQMHFFFLSSDEEIPQEPCALRIVRPIQQGAAAAPV
jgi:hypothetical protein